MLEKEPHAVSDSLKAPCEDDTAAHYKRRTQLYILELNHMHATYHIRLLNAKKYSHNSNAAANKIYMCI